MTKPLSIDDLYTDTGTFDQQKVLETLHKKIVFTRDNGILFIMDPSKTKAKNAILLYALAKKILKMNGKIEDECINTAEILEKTKLKKSTVSVTLMRLKDKTILVYSEKGYEIPMFKVSEAIDFISNDKEE